MRNILINMMRPEVSEAIEFASSRIYLKMGDAIPGDDLEGNFVFLIEDGIISHCLPGADGLRTDVGIVGREGLFPFAPLLDVPAKSGAAVAQINNVIVRRIATRDFNAAIALSRQGRQKLNRLLYAYMTQVYANFMARHQAPVISQVARWILMCHDRVDGHSLEMTHDMLAGLTGCLRPTVSKSLCELRKMEAIDTGRGRIMVLSRRKLRAEAGCFYGHAEQYFQDHIGPFGRDPVEPMQARARRTAA